LVFHFSLEEAVPREHLLRRVVAALRTPAARRTRRQRSVWMETANAELKERHGLRRAQGRGRDAVWIQALLAASAYHVKQLAQQGHARPATGAAAQAVATADATGAPTAFRTGPRRAPCPVAGPRALHADQAKLGHATAPRPHRGRCRVTRYHRRSTAKLSRLLLIP
jgi:hypothetical protein